MTKQELLYTLCWILISLTAMLLMARKRGEFAILTDSYWRFLLVRWKIATFLVAAVGITAMGPFTNDPTWDFVTAPVMSILTFMTAPWCVGVLFRTIRRQLPLHQAVVAIVLLSLPGKTDPT